MKAATMGENVGKVSREQRLHSRHPASPPHVGPGVLETPDGAEWRQGMQGGNEAGTFTSPLQFWEGKGKAGPRRKQSRREQQACRGCRGTLDKEEWVPGVAHAEAPKPLKQPPVTPLAEESILPNVTLMVM